MTSAISSAKYSGASVSPPTKLKPRSSAIRSLQDTPSSHDTSAGSATMKPERKGQTGRGLAVPHLLRDQHIAG